MTKQPTEKHLATFRLSKDCRDKLKKLAENQNISQANIIQNLIKNKNIRTTTKLKAKSKFINSQRDTNLPL
jgi:predicted transcriptional regulator